MSKPNLRIRIYSTALLIAVLLSMLPLIPVHADSEALPSAQAQIWDGEIASDFSEGEGSRNSPYLISTADQLALLADRVNGGEDFSGQFFKLTADLYLNDSSQSDSPSPNEWTPIGGYISLSINSEQAYEEALELHNTLYWHTEEGYTPADRYVNTAIYYHFATFNGTFDGDGYGIYGLSLSSNQPCAGLFGACENVTIRNLTLDHTMIDAYEDSAALIGYLSVSNHADIENCTVNATVSASGNRIGGLIGCIGITAENASVEIEDSSFSGTINANNMVGALIGATEHYENIGKIEIEDCKVDADITARSTVGGFVGQLSLPATIISSDSEGSISANDNVGGIIGSVSSKAGDITFSDCQNNAAIVGQTAVGGIVGLCASETDLTENGSLSIELLSCVNLGDLFGSESVGGIIGKSVTAPNANLNINSCKNSAAIVGQSGIGGIAGSLTAKGGIIAVGNSENHGNVTSETVAGGIVGQADSHAELTIYQCFSYTTVTSHSDFAGGIAGKTTSQGRGNLLLELSCSNGTVKAESYAGGIVGSQTAADSSHNLLTNCFSYATITAVENAGGIAGSIEASGGQALATLSLFYGSFTSGSTLAGGIAAYLHAQSTAATTQVDQCYYLLSTASRPALLYGGAGNELCQTAQGLTDAEMKDAPSLIGLDFGSVWQASDEKNIYPILQSVPFVWANFEFSVSEQNAALVAYHGRSDIVTVPAKFNGAPVTKIEKSAFSGKTIIKVILPDSVNMIGDDAFADCALLRSITLPNSLSVVGSRAFDGCTSLKTLRAPNGLSALYTGEGNEYFTELSIDLPITLKTDFLYENGLTAAPSGTVTCYEGEIYMVEAPTVIGYKADLQTLAGICAKDETVQVIYRLGTYTLTVRYLYPDGSEAAPSYVASYQYGAPYSILSPELSGYLPANNQLEGIMAGEDMILTVYYSEELIESEVSHRTSQSLLIVLLICSAVALICCIGYFIFRYRSQPKDPDDSDLDHLLTSKYQ